MGAVAEARHRRLRPASEVAPRAQRQRVFADRRRVPVGRDAWLMDLLYRLAPRRAAGLIYRQMRSLLGEASRAPDASAR